MIWGYSWSFFSIFWGWWKLLQSFLTLTVFITGGLSVLWMMYLLYTVFQLQTSLTSSSKILNLSNSHSLALLLLLYSLYLFFAGFQFPEDSSSTCPVPFFHPTTHPLSLISFSVHSWCITPLTVSSVALPLCVLLVIYSASSRFWPGIFSFFTQWLPKAAWGNHSANEFIISSLRWNPRQLCPVLHCAAGLFPAETFPLPSNILATLLHPSFLY